MAAKKANPGFDFIIAALKKDPKATYKDIAAAAAKKKLKVFPIMFGRAQAMLGIVKQAKRGDGKAKKAKAPKKAPAVEKPEVDPVGAAYEQLSDEHIEDLKHLKNGTPWARLRAPSKAPLRDEGVVEKVGRSFVVSELGHKVLALHARS